MAVNGSKLCDMHDVLLLGCILSSSAVVDIRIEDVNDNSPIFLEPNYVGGKLYS